MNASFLCFLYSQFSISPGQSPTSLIYWQSAFVQRVFPVIVTILSPCLIKFCSIYNSNFSFLYKWVRITPQFQCVGQTGTLNITPLSHKDITQRSVHVGTSIFLFIFFADTFIFSISPNPGKSFSTRKPIIPTLHRQKLFNSINFQHLVHCPFNFLLIPFLI